MDPEQTFLRVHMRLSGMLSQLLTPRIRMVLEYIYLAVAVALFCLLVVMHISFVQQGYQAMKNSCFDHIRKILPSTRNIIEQMDKSGIPPSKAFEFFKEGASSSQNVGFLRIDHNNSLSSIKNACFN